MTKKHFVAVAAAMRADLACRRAAHGPATPNANASDVRAHRETCERLADVFASANANFKRATFLAACGVE